MHAIREILLFAPKFPTNSERRPIDPPPDIGRTIARGRISFGMLKKSVTGDNIAERRSTAPDSRSIAETTKIATRAGKIDRIVINPFSAPSMNES